MPAFNSPEDPTNVDKAGIVNFAGNLRVFGYRTVTPTYANAVGVAVPGAYWGLTPIVQSGLTLPRIADGTTNVIMLATKYSQWAPFLLGIS